MIAQLAERLAVVCFYSPLESFRSSDSSVGRALALHARGQQFETVSELGDTIAKWSNAGDLSMLSSPLQVRGFDPHSCLSVLGKTLNYHVKHLHDSQVWRLVIC